MDLAFFFGLTDSDHAKYSLVPEMDSAFFFGLTTWMPKLAKIRKALSLL